MKNTEEIECNSENVDRKNSFYKRWNLIEKIDNNKLKIRCMSVICEYIEYEQNCNDNDYGVSSHNELNKFCSNISMIMGIKNRNNQFSRFEDKDLYEYISELDLNDDDSYKEFINFIENILNYDFRHIEKYVFAQSIDEAFKLSNAHLKILLSENQFIIIPTDVEFLDNVLIFDNLQWLNKYDETKKHFLKAIKFERNERYYRNIIDELRVGLEELFKQLFSNKKSLENQKSELGNYLKDNNISSNISNMYVKLFDLYTIYNNDNAKHGDNINEVEIDYLIYLTGSFIRFIMQIEESKCVIKK